MLTTTLDHTEIQTIEQILRTSLEDLRSEIHHTDNLYYKADLKKEEMILQHLIAKLQPLAISEEAIIELS
jgi:hypothetical protein